MSHRFTRRDFAGAAGALAAGLAVPPGKAEAQTVSATPAMLANDRRFPADFVWGTATSAYQIEGAVAAEGRGPSIWDSYSNTPNKIRGGGNGDRAVDHFQRYKEDVQLMKALGAKAYRFSISWSRVFPTGVGTPNPQGLDFYNRLIDELLANGIEPFATLYHWDLPQALQDRVGGWASSDTSKAFGDYAGHVAQRITDRVKNIFTINECGTFVDFGYGHGPVELAPGLKLPQPQLNQVRHHVALGHGMAVQAIRANGRADTKVGVAENVASCVPAIETPANIRAAEIATREMNGGYMTVILEGRYTDAFLAYAGRNAPSFTAEELKIISSPVDFVGLNVYMPQYYVVASGDQNGFALVPFPTSFPRMDSDWLRIGPEALYWAPRNVAKVWNVKQIYISENGTSAADRPAGDGKIHDLDRVMYLRNYLTHLQRATSEGIPVKGYFHWSLMDNFEWSDGYEKRFGLYHVDFETQKRTPKLSAEFYRSLIAANALV
ncbi:GH1 family beta-glucosidase [Tardiphaga sp. 42S5]|uniref:GH1 family beta-glucosidase n=1 Tax=Tardiphaga sp. 42S5 TaxID=1404799 RepID=UPI002A5A6F50|nr:GH1 family beta-glucosidase [Tardiphaga sp. 42S5]WPO40342.1 GH1 family beta-glucosidase [Tardiphaga sp. 42S5]